MAKSSNVALALLALFGFPGGLALPAQKTKEADTFLREYETGIKPLKEFYSNVRLRARVKQVVKELRGQETTSWEYLFLANGPLIRLDEFGSAGILTSVAGGKDPPFRVKKGPGQHRYFLLGYGDRGTSPVSPEEVIRQFAPAPCETYCVAGIEILEYLRLPNLTITSVVRGIAGSESLIRVTYERTWKGRKYDKTVGWFLFAPDDCWAVRESGVEFPSIKQVKRVEYQGKHERIPLIKSLEFWFEDEGRKVESQRSVEVLELVPGAVPKEEFTLAAFGLSDAGLQETVPTWYYWQLAAVLALLAALVFWQLSRRGRSAGSPPAAAQG